MKKILNMAVALSVASMCVAAGAADATGPADDELAALNRQIEEMLKAAPKGSHGGKLISPELKELMDRRSGGLVYPKTNGKSLLLVDARGGEDDGFVGEFVKDMKRNFHLNVSTSRKTVGKDDDFFDAATGFKSGESPAVVMIVDAEKMPTLAVYPEDAVGVVNAARLKDGDAAKYRERLAKEVWRGMALALGGFAATAPNGRIVKSILSPAYSTADLDAIAARGLSPHQCNAIYESVSAIGLQAAKPVSYKMACKQGWAPAPTNSIQKAIWNEIHALPTDPIKIKPEEKKVDK